MTTTKLVDYRITCDRNYTPECLRELIVRDVTSKTEAEDRARGLGWWFIIMAGCPACERDWAARNPEVQARG